MTRIVLKNKMTATAVEIIDPVRTPREVIKAVNTGRLRIGPKTPGAARQWARYALTLGAVVVSKGFPPVRLSPRHYDILFCLCDGCTTDEIAHRLRICRRTVYMNIAEMKRRLNAASRPQMVALAQEMGLLCSELENRTFFLRD